MTQASPWQINIAVPCPSWKQTDQYCCPMSFLEANSEVTWGWVQEDFWRVREPDCWVPYSAWVFRTLLEQLYFRYCEFVGGWDVYKINKKNTLFGSSNELIHWLKMQIAFMQRKNGSYANLSYFLLPLVSDGRVIRLVCFLVFLVLGLLGELQQTGTNMLNSLKWYCASCSRTAFFSP